MRLVADSLQEYLHNRETCFVFPSEVAAAFWRRQALSLTANKAVRSDRFLSWDTFKEQIFAANDEAAPVNSFIRMFFASDLLYRNAEGRGFLKALLLPEHAESWRPFVKTVARMLPALEQLLEDRHAGALLQSGLREDLEAINREYKRFLKAHRLFEPLHEPARGEINRSTIVFFPDVILDFPEYEGLIGRKAVVAKRKLEPLGTTVTTYSNARVEVKQTCLACRKLLDAGVAPGAIAVTLSNPNGYFEELRDQAACYDIPLAQRVGKPLADYVEVRLYRLLSECIASGFSVKALKDLFLNAAHPWRNRGPGRGLVRFGIDNYGIQNNAGGGGGVDEWQRRLEIAGSDELREFYRRFRRYAIAVTQSATFADLRAAVMAFNSQFLDTNAFSEGQSLPFSAALDLLGRIEDTAAHIQDLHIDSPFSLWMLSLQDRRYVRQTRSDGIGVYDYRVAAGTYPDYHFILGVSQEASAVRTPKYRFLPLNMLPEDVWEAGDFTESFLRLYEHSGREVTFSAALEGFEGPVTAVRSFPSAAPASIESGAYDAELGFWAGTGSLLEPIHRVQRTGFEYLAGTGLVDKGIDITQRPIKNPVLAARIANRLFAAEGVLTISPTNLDIWKQCKFRFLLSRVLKLEETDFDTVYTDPRELGILYHRLFAEALRSLGDEVETETDEESPVPTVFRSVFLPWLGARFLAPVRNDIRRRAEHYLRMYLESDRCTFRESRIHSLEDELTVAIDAADVVLHGRIDRISEREGSYIVVDYKSRLRKKRSGMVTPAGELYSFQVPVYLLLVEANYGPVAEALYYDIQEAAYSTVFGGKKSWFDEEERGQLLRQTMDTIFAMSRSIDQSGYETPEGGCEPCEYRAICREKYRVR